MVSVPASHGADRRVRARRTVWTGTDGTDGRVTSLMTAVPGGVSGGIARVRRRSPQHSRQDSRVARLAEHAVCGARRVLTASTGCQNQGLSKPASSLPLPLLRTPPELLPHSTRNSVSPCRARRSGSNASKHPITPDVIRRRRVQDIARDHTLKIALRNPPPKRLLRWNCPLWNSKHGRQSPCWYNSTDFTASGICSHPCPSTVRKSASFDPPPKPTTAGTCPARRRSGSGKCGS